MRFLQSYYTFAHSSIRILIKNINVIILYLNLSFFISCNCQNFIPSIVKITKRCTSIGFSFFSRLQLPLPSVSLFVSLSLISFLQTFRHDSAVPRNSSSALPTSFISFLLTSYSYIFTYILCSTSQTFFYIVKQI